MSQEDLDRFRANENRAMNQAQIAAVTDEKEPEGKEAEGEEEDDIMEGVNMNLYDKPLPVETPDQFELMLAKLKRDFPRELFRDDEEFETFAMLPMPNVEKVTILLKRSEEMRAEREKRRATKGKRQSSTVQFPNLDLSMTKPKVDSDP